MAARSKLLPHQEVVAEKMGFVRGRKEIKRRRYKVRKEIKELLIY